MKVGRIIVIVILALAVPSLATASSMSTWAAGQRFAPQIGFGTAGSGGYSISVDAIG